MPVDVEKRIRRLRAELGVPGVSYSTTIAICASLVSIEERILEVAG